MSISSVATVSPLDATVPRQRAPGMARAVLCGLLVVAAAVGAGVTGAHETGRAVARAGTDWATLLRAMAALKTLMALAAAACVVWRLAVPANPAWLAAYSLAGMAMMAGPGLVWGLAHVGLGALLLHAGLATTLLLLWRDKQVGTRLAALVARRRASLRATGSRASAP